MKIYDRNKTILNNSALSNIAEDLTSLKKPVKNLYYLKDGKNFVLLERKLKTLYC